MSDIFTKRKRSDVMSRIRGSGNRDTELRLIQVFRANGITGWRRGSNLPGKPDFVFPKLRTAVFVDGCYWHGCPWHATRPKTHTKFWRGTEREERGDGHIEGVARRVSESGCPSGVCAHKSPATGPAISLRPAYG